MTRPTFPGLATRALTLALLLGCIAGCFAGCFAPPQTQSDSLPLADAPAPSFHEYRVEPEVVVSRPPLDPLRLLATHPGQRRWAASDGRRLWIGEGERLIERDRDHGTRLRAIAIDEAGALWLLDERDELTRLDASGEAEPMPPPPVTGADQLIAVGSRLLILGELREGVAAPPIEPSASGALLLDLDDRVVLGISDDGRSWRLRRRPYDGSQFDDLSVTPEGELQLMDGDELPCGGGGQERWTAHLDRPGWTALPWPLDTYDDRTAGSDGWSYGYAYAGEGEALFAVDPEGELHELPAVESRYAMVHDGRSRTTMLLTDSGLWSILGGSATRIGAVDPAVLEAGHDAAAIGFDGAVILSVDDTIHVGRAEGWTRLRVS